MPNPIFHNGQFRRDLPEARDLERELWTRFFDERDIKTIIQVAGMNTADITWMQPLRSLWGESLDLAARVVTPEDLLKSIEQELKPLPKDAAMRAVIQRVRAVDQPGGSLSPMRLLLAGDRPFLGRPKLREVLPELRNWESTAAILVVRGVADSGRTETQVLLLEGNADRVVVVNEDLPLGSSLRAIWRAAGMTGDPPRPDQEPLSTESAILLDFWTDIWESLEAQNRRMWVLFDDLDKGPGRVQVRTLAEVLAIRLKDIPFQRRFRMAMLGYPDPKLPPKVSARVVRDDETEVFDDSHVRAFLDYCMQAAGKNFDESWLKTKATDLCTRANSNVNAENPYHAALNAELTAWYKSL